MDNSAQLERERIVSLLRAEQKIVDDQLSEMLIERLINKISAAGTDQRHSDEMALPVSRNGMAALANMTLSGNLSPEVIDELNLIKARAMAIIARHP